MVLRRTSPVLSKTKPAGTEIGFKQNGSRFAQSETWGPQVWFRGNPLLDCAD